ncbi:hypothetical protein ACWEOI_12675 [Nocardia sp. NPDC004340]
MQQYENREQNAQSGCRTTLSRSSVTLWSTSATAPAAHEPTNVGPVMSRFFLSPGLPEQVDAATALEVADRFLPFALRSVRGSGERPT